MKRQPKIIYRKTGAVSILYVELLAAQMQRLNEYVEKLGMSKGAIVEQALQLWFSAVDKGDKE